MYFDFELKEQTYKLRLTTKTTMDLEKKLGCNPIGIFGSGDRIPSVTEMVAILHASLQANHHGMSIDKVADIFDKFLEEHTVTEFIPVIVGIYRASGIIARGTEEEKN